MFLVIYMYISIFWYYVSGVNGFVCVCVCGARNVPSHVLCIIKYSKRKHFTTTLFVYVHKRMENVRNLNEYVVLNQCACDHFIIKNMFARRDRCDELVLVIHSMCRCEEEHL